MAALGWVAFQFIDIPPNEINNPRPEHIEAWNTGKDSLAHWINDYPNSACGKAKYMTSALDMHRDSVAVKDIDNLPEGEHHWSKFTLICKECYRIFKATPHPRF